MGGSRWERTTFRLGCLLVSGLLSLAAAEVFSRLFLYGWAGLSPAMVDSTHPLGRSGMLQASPHRKILWELKPNLKTVFKLVPFETNTRGLRDREYAFEKPPGTWRAVVIGDSYTMGSGVKIEDVFHSILESRFNEELAPAKFEFIGFGVGGYSLEQYLAVLRHTAIHYRPDLILVGFGRNDTQPRPKGFYSRRYRPKPVEKPSLNSQLLLLVTETHRHRTAEAIRYDRDFHLNRRQRAFLHRSFGELAALAGDVPVVIAFLRHYDLGFDVARGLSDISRIHGLHFVDTQPAFQGLNPRSLNISPIDGHPNAKANRIFADVIADFLLSNRLLPDSDDTQD